MISIVQGIVLGVCVCMFVSTVSWILHEIWKMELEHALRVKLCEEEWKRNGWN
jgi:hypothetical protein